MDGKWHNSLMHDMKHDASNTGHLPVFLFTANQLSGLCIS